MQSGRWIIRPFNGIFMTVSTLFFCILLFFSRLLHGKSEKTRSAILITACLLTLAGFAVYKYYLSLDAEYDVLTAQMGGFNWWGELPLHLCNINMVLIPAAVLTKNRTLMSFCFFVGPLGALMALIMPGTGFDGYSLLLPRMLGYYGTHFMVLIEGLAIVTFGLYRPALRDMPGTLLAMFLVTFLVFLINMVLRTSGLHPKANYFFSVETEGNVLLEIFHKWIPVSFLYLLPAYGILIPYIILVCLPFEISKHRRR